MAFSQINCVALATMNNTPEYIPTLARGWNALGLAAIIRDEIYDWRQDYCKANYTYLLSQILLSPPFREQVESGRFPAVNEVGAALFCTESIESLNELAYQELLAAAELIRIPLIARGLAPVRVTRYQPLPNPAIEEDV